MSLLSMPGLWLPARREGITSFQGVEVRAAFRPLRVRWRALEHSVEETDV